MVLLGAGRKSLVFLDGLEHLASPEDAALLTDTLKGLSDRAAPATVVMAGNQQSLERLLASHPSIHRCLIQVRTPPEGPP